MNSAPTTKGEIPAIAPKCTGIATPPRAGQASPSPTAESERCGFGRRVGVSVTLWGKRIATPVCALARNDRKLRYVAGGYDTQQGACYCAGSGSEVRHFFDSLSKIVSLRTSDRCHWCGNPFPHNVTLTLTLRPKPHLSDSAVGDGFPVPYGKGRTVRFPHPSPEKSYANNVKAAGVPAAFSVSKKWVSFRGSKATVGIRTPKSCDFPENLDKIGIF